jgi:hypothetical protein
MADDETTEPAPEPPARVTRNVFLGITTSQAADVTKGATVNVDFPGNISVTAPAPQIVAGDPPSATEEVSPPAGSLEPRTITPQETVALSARATLGGRGSALFNTSPFNTSAFNAPPLRPKISNAVLSTPTVAVEPAPPDPGADGGTTVTVDSPVASSTTASTPQVAPEAVKGLAGAVAPNTSLPGVAARGEAGSVGHYTLAADVGRYMLGDGSVSQTPPDETTLAAREPTAFDASAFDSSAFQTGGETEAVRNVTHATADVILPDVSQTARATVEQPRRMRTAIGRSVQRNRSVIVVQVAALLALIDDKVTSLQDERPNAPEAITARDETIAQFESLKRALEAIHSATVRIESDRGAETRAKDATKSFVECIRNWWNEDHVEICRATFKVSLFMSCIGVCSLVGASAPAIAVSGALIGGKPVVDALKNVANGLRRAPGSTND